MEGKGAVEEGPDVAFASLSITHVHYNADDPLSLLCAYLSLIPQALIIAYIVLIWSHRELEVILMLAGQLGCEAINYTLKHVIKESRPEQMQQKGYGMPSSHAQFIFFFAVYLSLWVSCRTNYKIKLYNKLLSVLMLLGMASSVASARVYLFYHTPKQVAVGISVGTFLGIAHFIATYILRTIAGGYFWNMLLDNPISNWFYIKDVSRDAMIQEQEYIVWQQRRMRGRQVAKKEE